jgi:hypothetical protein
MNIPRASTPCAMYALLIAIALLAPSHARADLISIQSDVGNSTESLGALEGSMEYSSLGGGSGTLVITLTNTSGASNGGFITGLLFNFDSVDGAASAMLASGTHPFTDTGGGNGAPFGDNFDAGAALGGNFLGGGSPNAGIAIGQTGTFIFNILASDAASLTASSFLSGPYEFDFIVRFKGFENGGSDKVPVTVVPAPGSLAVLASALLLTLRRRRTAG